MGGRLTPEELQHRIHAAGYDRPLVVQYLDYLGGLLRGDLGTTLTDNQPVTTILTRYGATRSSSRSTDEPDRRSDRRHPDWAVSPPGAATTPPMRASACSPSCAMRRRCSSWD